jgi:hypothetical protein
VALDHVLFLYPAWKDPLAPLLTRWRQYYHLRSHQRAGDSVWRIWDGVVLFIDKYIASADSGSLYPPWGLLPRRDRRALGPLHPQAPRFTVVGATRLAWSHFARWARYIAQLRPAAIRFHHQQAAACQVEVDDRHRGEDGRRARGTRASPCAFCAASATTPRCVRMAA